MGVLADWQIEQEVKIVPFAAAQVSKGVISYGVTSYGYDVRVDRRFKVFTNARCAVVDPKNFDPHSFIDIEGDHCLIPPNSFALAETVEYLEIPRSVIGVCVGKCLTGDTRVVDSRTGDYLPLEQFVAEKRGETPALDGLKLRNRAVSDHLCNGREPVYKLTTKCGLEVRATATHPFRRFDDWVPLSELRPGDRIAVARSCPVFGTTELPEHEATLLGLLISDGQCRTPGSSPRYTTDDPRLVKVLTEAAERFGVHISPVGCYGYNLVNRRGRGGVATPNRVYSWLVSHGCACLPIHKSVPPAVFRAPRPAVASFLRALFSGDGSVYTSTSKKGTVGICVEYSSTSERLARDVRHLLLRFGIFGRVRSRESASGRTAFRVQITDMAMIHRFAAEIGFIAGCKKQLTLESVVAEVATQPRTHRTNFDTLPEAVATTVRETVRRSDVSLNGIGRRLTSGQSVPYALVRTLATATENQRLAELADNDVVWDQVESVVPDSVETVYDLTVPGDHNFIANDINVHNSTYARCGIIVNVTPLEPEWRGRITIEISNTTPLPAKIYAGEGIAQILFLRAEQPCRISYADKAGKYQDQKGLQLPFVLPSTEASE